MNNSGSCDQVDRVVIDSAQLLVVSVRGRSARKQRSIPDGDVPEQVILLLRVW